MGESSKILGISTFKSLLLVLGAYTFSYCLGLTFHETGHAIANTIIGLTDVQIFVHPFSLSHTVYSGIIPTEFMPFTGSMGPLFNITCSLLITLVTWKWRDPKLLPLLMCAGTALTSEGIAMFMSLAQLPALTDWGQVIIVGGVSPIFIGIISFMFTFLGVLFMLLLMPMLNISSFDSYLRKLLITSGFTIYFIISVIYVGFFDPGVLQNRLIALIVNIGLIVTLNVIYKPAFPYLDKLSHTETSEVKWSTISIALGLAFAIISIDLIFFY